MLPPSIITSLIVITTLAVHPSAAQPATRTSTSSPSTPAILTQHIFHPAHKDLLVPGSVSTIRWTANPAFQNITLQLWDNTPWGYSRDLLSPCIPWGRNPFCGTIALHAPNTGAFDWYVPNPATPETPGYGFPRDEQVFWVKLFVEDYVNEKVGNARPVVSWSQNFAFAKDGENGSVVDVPEESSSNAEWDGVPVYVTDGVSAAASSALDTVAATTTSVMATATTTGTSTHVAPKNGLVTQVAKGEAAAAAAAARKNGRYGMWVLGVLSLVLGNRM